MLLNPTYTDEDTLTGNEHILVVDDDDMIIQILQLILEGLGYQVTTQMSSIKAFEIFRSQPDKYDLVFSDTMMPDMTGDILTQKILKVRSDIPIILSTGFSKQIDNEKAKSIGARALVEKPFKRIEIATIIRKVLDNKLTY